MRALLTLTLLGAVAATGCASRDTMRALQAPPNAPQGVIAFDSGHQYRDAIVIDWVGGVSRRSYLFSEPNQRVIRPIVQAALDDAGLGAGTNVRARYGLRVMVDEAVGPGVGADFESTMAATYVLVDRETGAEVWRREIVTPGASHFLAFNESDWHTAWFVDPVLAVYTVVNPFNYLPIASDSAADRARDNAEGVQSAMRQQLVSGVTYGGVDRMGHSRAARANYEATRMNTSAFLVAFAADQQVEMTPVLPCWGSPEEEARKVELMASGRNFRTDDCRVRR